MDAANLQVRDARDRLTELLGIGQPYPLRDLPVPSDQLLVVIDTSAKIPIEFSQRGVMYQLYLDGQPVQHTADNQAGTGTPIQAEGNGATLYLETYRIEQDTTFDIYATKIQSGRAATLFQQAQVNVGLNAALNARIISLPLLDPTLANSPPLADYGAQVQVIIEASQEGVDYHLVYLDGSGQEVVFSDPVRGDLHDITLTSQPVTEDMALRIHATKTFDAAENRPTQNQILNVVLPLAVQANPALAVSIQPGAIVAYNAAPTVTVASTQTSASYQLFVHRLRDDEFIYGAVGNQAVLTISVPNADAAQVAPPPAGAVDTAGYAADGQVTAGTGADLALPGGALADDVVLLVRATKAHPVGDQTRLSVVTLKQALLVLAEPNPAPPLRVRVGIDGQQTDGTLEVFDGQPGVFYAFSADAKVVGLPAYFHQRDATNTSFNKGLNQLRLSVDYVVERSYAAANPAQTPPDPPLITTDSLALGTSLSVEATKARTRVSVTLTPTISLTAPPAVQANPALIDFNTAAKIVITASVAGESYQPLLAGQPLGDVLAGTGQDLSFDTPSLSQDTEIIVLITRPDSSPIIAERLVRLTVLVRPDTGLSVRLLNDPVTPQTAAQLQVDASQTGVSYQLLLEAKPVGVAVVGTGAPITLTSDPISADTIFVVHATRVDRTDIAVDLTQTITAKLVTAAPPA